MRAGFIPARPERKESIMAVPASKRARAMGEYVIQARIVLAETQHVMRIVYEAYTAAYAADVIYASTVEEQRLRLERIYAAYGRINALAGLVDLWIDQPPQAAAPHMDTDGTMRYRDAIKPERLRNYAGTLAKAIGVFTGTIRWQRDSNDCRPAGLNNNNWWERSSNPDNTNNFLNVNPNGDPSNNNANNRFALVPDSPWKTKKTKDE